MIMRSRRIKHTHTTVTSLSLSLLGLPNEIKTRQLYTIRGTIERKKKKIGEE